MTDSRDTRIWEYSSWDSPVVAGLLQSACLIECTAGLLGGALGTNTWADSFNWNPIFSAPPVGHAEIAVDT